MHGFSPIKFGFDSVLRHKLSPKKNPPSDECVGLSMQRKFLMNDELYYNI
jgi:hypothetical protein